MTEPPAAGRFYGDLAAWSPLIRRVPVVEGGRPVGIISMGDLAIERDHDSPLADISAAEGNN